MTTKQPSTAPDTAAVRELLSMMTTTMSTLGQTLETLTEQSAKVATLGPQMDSAHQISQLRRQMRSQEKVQDNRINDVKKLIQEVLKEQVADILRPQIKTDVAVELKVQTNEEVAAQLKERMPISLGEQAAESQQQLKDVRASLINAESRRANAILRASNLDDHIAAIMKPNGDESKYFPQDLKTLFSYDSETAKSLVTDYGLTASESREKNLNKFMAHCGIQFHLIPVPILNDSSAVANSLGISMS